MQVINIPCQNAPSLNSSNTLQIAFQSKKHELDSIKTKTKGFALELDSIMKEMKYSNQHFVRVCRAQKVLFDSQPESRFNET